MNWTIEEERICCENIVSTYVISKATTDVEDVLQKIKLYPEFAMRDIGSIRMRIQNIKALLEEFEIQNTLTLKPLRNVAKQTREVLLDNLKIPS